MDIDTFPLPTSVPPNPIGRTVIDRVFTSTIPIF